MSALRKRNPFPSVGKHPITWESHCGYRKRNRKRLYFRMGCAKDATINAVGKNMLTLIKLVAGAAIAFGILSPGFKQRADTCECKAKAGTQQFVPHADTCECKAKTP